MEDLRYVKDAIGMPPDTTEIHSLNEYLDIIGQIKSNYDCGFKGDALWYRGIANIDRYTLLPAVFRGTIFDKNEIRYYGEAKIFESFKKESRGYIDVQDDDFLLLCYAQHFGVPTRLLDFSTNPLVALYFACKDLKSKDGAVWVLNSNQYNKEVLRIARIHNNESITIELMQEMLVKSVSESSFPKQILQFPIAVEPYYIDQRMSSQGSRFLLWGDTPVQLERMLCFGDYINNACSNQDAFVKRIRIPHNKKASFLDDMDMLGINEKSMFPGLDGVGKYINIHFSVEQQRNK